MGLPVAVGRSGRYFHKGGGAVAETVAQMKVYRRKGGWDGSGGNGGGGKVRIVNYLSDLYHRGSRWDGSGGDGGGGKVRIVNYLSDLYHKEVNIRRRIKRVTCIGR